MTCRNADHLTWPYPVSTNWQLFFAFKIKAKVLSVSWPVSASLRLCLHLPPGFTSCHPPWLSSHSSKMPLTRHLSSSTLCGWLLQVWIPSLFFIKKTPYIYLFIWQRWVLVGHRGSWWWPSLELWHADAVATAPRLSGPKACGILVPRPGIEPTSFALEGGFLTTGPPGKSPIFTEAFPASPTSQWTPLPGPLWFSS